MRKIKTSVEEIEYLKVIKMCLVEQLKLSNYYIKYYIHNELGHGNDPEKAQEHLHNCKVVIQQSERGYK